MSRTSTRRHPPSGPRKGSGPITGVRGNGGRPPKVIEIKPLSGRRILVVYLLLVAALTGLAGQMVAQAMTGDASRFDVFARLRHRTFPGGALLRMPALVLGMAWYRLRDLLG